MTFRPAISSWPSVAWRDAAGPRTALWLSPGTPAPPRLASAGDATTAAAALAALRRGQGLVYRGDYHNARQLLTALGRRLDGRRPTRAGSPAELFHAERERTRRAHAILSLLAVPVGADGSVALRRAPRVAEPLVEALGALPPGEALLPLRDLLGMIGAHEWRRRGVAVPALGGERVHPWYGVYAPVRGEYVDLVAQALARWPAAGRSALDVGTGTGVLAVLLARGGARVTATDLAPEAVGCARANAARLAPGAVEVEQADLFPAGARRFDLVVCNPPWVPAEPHTPLDRAVYDPGGGFLARLVAGLPARLAPGGEAWIVLSDLAERLGLRPAGHLAALAAEAGLRVDGVLETRPVHPRARDEADPLHAHRAAEVVRLTRLVAA